MHKSLDSKNKMKIINLFFFLILLLVLTSCEKLNQKDLYSCGNVIDMNSCSKSCKQDDESIKIKTDKNANRVQIVNYYKGSQGRAYILENCKVIDDANWECTSNIEKMIFKVNNFEKMAEGRYLYFHQMEFRDDEKSAWRPGQAFIRCTK